MQIRPVKVFVSSPGDVAPERAAIDRVAARLSGMIDGLVIETYRWERGHHFSAHKGFQPQIPDPAEFDIVIAVFWSRIGSPLPPDFQPMPDGRPYPSGAAFEVLRAIERRRSAPNGGPDVFVYRKTASPQISVEDAATRERQVAALEGVDKFFAEWFVNEADGFKAAFTPFAAASEFEALIESHLRAWLTENRRTGAERVWRIEERGSPFCGLSAFDAAHRDVFFGRRADVERARERLMDAAAQGCAFLMIEGSSGSGKSSLARAGVMPRLADVTPDLRLVVMRPDGDALGTLAARLFADDAVPELAQGDYPSPEALARHFAAGGGVEPVLRALDRASAARDAAQAAAAGSPPIDLAVLVDQVEEVFGAETLASARARFFQTLATLARSGRAYVVTTMRTDARAAALADPALARLIDDGAQMVLTPPGADALAEIVRGPAAAAGLAFGRDAQGVGLDERLIADAGTMDALPLLQFALQQLLVRAMRASPTATAADTQNAPRATLSPTDYDALGGISGVVDRQAEAALADLSAPAQAATPRLVRSLTDAGPQGEPVLRTAHADEIGAGAAGGVLVRSLVDARILVREGGSVRFSHQTALTGWRRAAATAAEARTFLRVRADIERQGARWAAEGRRRGLLLRGVPLAEAAAALKHHGDELPLAARRFVERSRAFARLALTLTAAAAAIFAFAAGVAVWQYGRAERQTAQAETAREDAEAALRAATEASNSLMFDIAADIRDRGLPIGMARTAIDRARALQEELAERFPDDAQLQVSRANALRQIGNVAYQSGDATVGAEVFEEALAIFRRIAARNPENTEIAHAVARTLAEVGVARGDEDDPDTTLALYDESRDILAQISAQEPETMRFADDAAWVASLRSDVFLEIGDADEALRAAEDALAIARGLVQHEPETQAWSQRLASTLNTVGTVRLFLFDDAKSARDASEESLAIRRALSEKDPQNAELRKQLARGLRFAAAALSELGEQQQALEYTRESLSILEALAKADPENAVVASSLANAMSQIGIALERYGDQAGSLAAHEAALALWRKADERYSTPTRRASLAGALHLVGLLRRRAGDGVGALSAFEEYVSMGSLPMSPAETAADRDRYEREALATIGELRLAQGDAPGAVEVFAELVERLPTRDLSADAALAAETARALEGLGRARSAVGDADGQLSAVTESVAIRRDLAAATGADVDAAFLLGQALADLGDARRATEDRDGARVAYSESADVARGLFDQSERRVDAGVLLSRALAGRATLRLDASTLDDLKEARAVFATVEAETAGSVDDAIGVMLDRLEPVIEQLETARLNEVSQAIGDDLDAAQRAFQEGDYAEAARRQAQAVLVWTSEPSFVGSNPLDLSNAHATLALFSMLSNDDAAGRAAAAAAISVHPGNVAADAFWGAALMYDGELAAALDTFKRGDGKTLADGRRWRDYVAEIFAALRAAGRDHPLMAQIEAALAPP